MFSASAINSMDYVEDLLAESLHHLLRLDWANPPYPAGGEILLDALRRGGWCRLEKARLELQPMCAVVEPLPCRRDPFSCGNRSGMSHHRDKIPVPACLDAQHAEAAFVIVEGDALDDVGQHLLRRLLGLCGIEGDDGVLERGHLLEEVSYALRHAAGIAAQERAPEMVDAFCEAAGGQAAIIQAMGLEEDAAMEWGECFLTDYAEVCEELGLQLDT